MTRNEKGRRDKDKQDSDSRPAQPPGESAEGGAASSEAGPVEAHGWEDRRRCRWRPFQVPGPVSESHRITFTRESYADLVAHAKENLAGEVCGVLAGEFCEDDRGEYVSVEAAVRGSSAQQGTAHVTYTQETWDQIHETMERRYPKLQIVGWYHSHPNFGVEFSDMDLFIQKNFFAGRGQVAFVTDPLGGEEALCVNEDGAIKHLSRFWVDGRERHCYVPSDAAAASGGGDTPGGASNEQVLKALREVEDRLNQSLHAMEDVRANFYRFLTGVGFLLILAVGLFIGKQIYTTYFVPEPKIATVPLTTTMPVPVKVGNEWRWLGVHLVLEALPAQIETQLRELDRQSIEADMKKEQEDAAAKAGSAATPAKTTVPATSSSHTPPAK